MGSFQYFLLYICPAPGNTIANHMARFGLGRHLFQSFLGFTFCARIFPKATESISTATVSIATATESVVCAETIAVMSSIIADITVRSILLCPFT